MHVRSKVAWDRYLSVARWLGTDMYIRSDVVWYRRLPRLAQSTHTCCGGARRGCWVGCSSYLRHSTTSQLPPLHSAQLALRREVEIACLALQYAACSPDHHDCSRMYSMLSALLTDEHPGVRAGPLRNSRRLLHLTCRLGRYYYSPNLPARHSPAMNLRNLPQRYPFDLGTYLHTPTHLIPTVLHYNLLIVSPSQTRKESSS